jgi:hypothetical protein
VSASKFLVLHVARSQGPLSGVLIYSLPTMLTKPQYVSCRVLLVVPLFLQQQSGYLVILEHTV